MRKILCYALSVAMAALACAAGQQTPAKKSAATGSAAPVPAKKSTVPATTAHAPATTAHKAPAKAPAKGTSTTPPKTTASASARSKNSKKAAPRTTWRNRQMAPTPDRYKEIQDALVAKGYLKSEDAGSGWNQTSMDALKRFQEEQKIEATGKINSLSLIALGLGPKHEANPAKPADPGSSPDR